MPSVFSVEFEYVTVHKDAKFSENLAFFALWYAYVPVSLRMEEVLLFQRIMCTYYIYDHYLCIEANSEYTSYFIQRKKESKHKQNIKFRYETDKEKNKNLRSGNR